MSQLSMTCVKVKEWQANRSEFVIFKAENAFYENLGITNQKSILIMASIQLKDVI